MSNNLITLDIETVALPDDEIVAMLPPFNPNDVSVPGNYKKQDTIDAYIADAKANYGKDIIAKAALSPRYGRIAIIGYMVNGEASQLWESDLAIVWSVLADAVQNHHARISGFCIKSFDLPFMIRRSLALGITVPTCIWRPNFRFPYQDSVVDLAEVWQAMNGNRENTRLSDILLELGLPSKSGTGKDFVALWASDKKAALEYNRRDLECEAALADKLGIQ